ncbi:anti-sigma factor [Acetobacteraceae bacterium H6797]|nr:anti-sigma factor [Acetobacteraceae bacterium H6797]
MRQPPDTVTDIDLAAYVDGQLDIARKIEVEDYLAHHPEAAAEVMADLHLNDTLRLTLAQPTESPSQRLIAAARRLERGLTIEMWLRRMVNGATAAAYIGLGWWSGMQLWPSVIAEGEASAVVPTFVEEAARAHHISLLRAAMASQEEDPTYDAEEITAMTAIILPRLPEEWKVMDVQIYPARTGPSIEMMVSVPDLGNVSIFTVRSVDPGKPGPRQAHFNNQNSIWWYVQDVAHAITGPFPADELRSLALHIR